jgi:group I intron endonuclease
MTLYYKISDFQMIGCIYLITNTENGKKYVGQHNKPDPSTRFKQHIKSAIKDQSHFLLHNSIRKYGAENFKIETLCTCPWDSLDNMEGYYAEQYESYIWDANPGYNMILCGVNGGKNREETFAKIGAYQKGRKKSPEHIAKIAASNKGQIHSPERRLKNSIAQTGKKLSEETIAKMVLATTGKPKSPEHCAAMSQARIGKKRSEETIAQIHKTLEENGTSRKGVAQSDEVRAKRAEAMQNPETRKKISDSLKGKVQSEDTKAKRSASMKATLAAKRAAKAIELV